MTRARLTLTLLLMVRPWLFASAQAPSQRELNGFLIGQTDRAIAASFTTLMQADTTSDGWVDRVYLLDRAHRAYMAFKFPADRPHQTVSVQIAGDSATPMTPFLGIRLGDHRDSMLARLGTASRVSHENDVDVDLYEYSGRNYSLEVDSRGRVSSIQIFGTEGFQDHPGVAMSSPDSLLAALQAGGHATLEALAPDAEVYWGGTTTSFEHGALQDLQGDSTPIAKALLVGPQSVRSVLAVDSVRQHADRALRVWEKRAPGMVWKFHEPAPIAEIVFVIDAGRWRVWEIRYR